MEHVWSRDSERIFWKAFVHYADVMIVQPDFLEEDKLMGLLPVLKEITDVAFVSSKTFNVERDDVQR